MNSQNQMRNPALVAPLREQAIKRWLLEIEAAESDLPAAKKRAEQIVADARARLAAAYTAHEIANAPLQEWTEAKNGQMP